MIYFFVVKSYIILTTYCGERNVAVRARDLELVERLSPTAASSAASATRQLLDAACVGSLEDVVRLLEHGARINATVEHGRTAVMYAAKEGEKETAKLLVEQGGRPSPKASACDGAIGAPQG